MRDGGGLLTLPSVRKQEAIDFGLQRGGCGCRRDDAAGDGYPACQQHRALRLRLCPAQGSCPKRHPSWFLPRIVGISQALEWCYSGRIFDAEEARAGGLVRSVHAPEDLLFAARALALEIAENTSAISVAMTRAMMWRLMSADHPMEAHKIDSRAIYRLSRGADAKEGIASFLEKRKPMYPAKVSADMPDFYPWWDNRAYE